MRSPKVVRNSLYLSLCGRQVPSTTNAPQFRRTWKGSELWWHWFTTTSYYFVRYTISAQCSLGYSYLMIRVTSVLGSTGLGIWVSWPDRTTNFAGLTFLTFYLPSMGYPILNLVAKVLNWDVQTKKNLEKSVKRPVSGKENVWFLDSPDF